MNNNNNDINNNTNEDDKNEILLQENSSRFVLFPIKYDNNYTKKQKVLFGQ